MYSRWQSQHLKTFFFEKARPRAILLTFQLWPTSISTKPLILWFLAGKGQRKATPNLELLLWIQYGHYAMNLWSSIFLICVGIFFYMEYPTAKSWLRHCTIGSQLHRDNHTTKATKLNAIYYWPPWNLQLQLKNKSIYWNIAFFAKESTEICGGR